MKILYAGLIVASFCCVGIMGAGFVALQKIDQRTEAEIAIDSILTDCYNNYKELPDSLKSFEEGRE
jgi:CHASE3 domain sensor protein